jgi:hypothetical protein
MQDITSAMGQMPQAEAPAPEGENPLDKMAEITKEKPKKSKGSSKEELDEEVLRQMLMTGDNTEGLFTPDKPVDEEKDGVKLHEEVDEEAEIKTGSIKARTDKYAKKFREGIMKHPQDYKVNTPRGEMTIKEAMAKGYNPITKRFDETKVAGKIVEKHTKELNDADKAAVESVLDPKSANIAPADASQFGLSSDSPMIRQEQSEVQPTQGTPAQGAPDISAMLGGM